MLIARAVADGKVSRDNALKKGQKAFLKLAHNSTGGTTEQNTKEPAVENGPENTDTLATTIDTIERAVPAGGDDTDAFTINQGHVVGDADEFAPSDDGLQVGGQNREWPAEGTEDAPEATVELVGEGVGIADESGEAGEVGSAAMVIAITNARIDAIIRTIHIRYQATETPDMNKPVSVLKLIKTIWSIIGDDLFAAMLTKA